MNEKEGLQGRKEKEGKPGAGTGTGIVSKNYSEGLSAVFIANLEYENRSVNSSEYPEEKVSVFL